MADGLLVSGVLYLSSAGFKERFAHLGFPLSLVAAPTGDASRQKQSARLHYKSNCGAVRYKWKCFLMGSYMLNDRVEQMWLLLHRVIPGWRFR